MDKSRWQFEEEFKRQYSIPLTDSDVFIKEIAWKFWQASRESLKVELPKPKIKHHQLRELVNAARDTAVKYQGCQCLRSALTTALKDSLINNGVEVDG